MLRIVGGMFVLGLAAVLVAPLSGEDKKPEKKPAKKDTYAGVFSFPKQIKLDEKQQAKVDELKKEYSPKLAEVDKKRSAILTPDRLKKAAEARKKIADEAKGKELTKEEKKELGQKLSKAYNSALALTKDEQKELGAINKERGGLLKEISTKKMAILTDAQKETLKTKPKKGKDK